MKAISSSSRASGFKKCCAGQVFPHPFQGHTGAVFHLECIAKPSREVVEADERAAEMEEGFVDVVSALVAYRQPAVTGEPCQ